MVAIETCINIQIEVKRVIALKRKNKVLKMADIAFEGTNNTMFHEFKADDSVEWVTPSPSSTLLGIQSLSCDDTVKILTERDPSLIVNEMIPEWKKENANMMKDMFTDLLSTKSSTDMVDENFNPASKKENERGSVFEFWNIKNSEKKTSKTVNFSSLQNMSNSVHKLDSFSPKNNESSRAGSKDFSSGKNIVQNNINKKKEDQKMNQTVFNYNLSEKNTSIEPPVSLNDKKEKNMASPTKSPLKLFHDNFDTFTNNKLTAAVYELANQEIDGDSNTSVSGPERKRLRISHERVNSITTQDFLNDAQEIMERIRNRRNTVGKSILESVCEEENVCDSLNVVLSSQKEKSSALKSKRNSINSCLTTLNETPTRSMFSDWSSEQTSSKNTLVSHIDSSIKCCQQKKHLDFVKNTKPQQTEKKEIFDSLKQTWKEPTFKQPHNFKTSVPFANKEPTNGLNYKLISSENLKIITPQDVSQFLSDRIGSMTLDKTENKWVQDLHDKTEDVFEGIQDFPISPNPLNEEKENNVFEDKVQTINKNFKPQFQKETLSKELCTKKLKDEIKEPLKKETMNKDTLKDDIYSKKANFNKESEIFIDDVDNLMNFKICSESKFKNNFQESFIEEQQSFIEDQRSSIENQNSSMQTPKHERLVNKSFTDIYKDSINSKFLEVHQDLSNTTLNCSFSIAIQNLVAVLTDIEPYEPFWEKIQHLNFSDKNIESLIGLSFFYSNTKLESLIGLSDLCPKLTSLDVSYNGLTFLTGCPKAIRNINIQNNNLSSLTGFSHLTNIQYLNLSNNEIKSLKSLSVLVHLRQLNASNNKISSLDGIQKLDGLLDLSLSQNLLSDIDLSNYNLSKLEQLDLSCNKINKLIGIHNLHNLMVLNLDKNNLSAFDVKEKMPKLRVLKLSMNSLKKFDPINFSNLRILFLDSNNLQSINEINCLKKMECLSIRNQKIGRLNIELSSLMNIRKIYMSLNPICSLSLSSPLLTLQYLELVNVQITSLPESFSKMGLNLRTLNLSYNHLKDISPLKGMPMLKRLFINGNQISKISNVVEILSTLKSLQNFDMRLNPCVINLYPPFFSLDSNNSSIHFSLQMKLYDNTWVEKDKAFFKTLPKKLQLRRGLYRDLILSSCPLLKWLNGKNISENHVKSAIKSISSITFDSNPNLKKLNHK
ncbi:hypothetical protein PORY_001246 [Pneumocystis oryctolagi]|uniref:Uncharacterized protein n=1 Tax=Pneumocystis oryctolagi TaxID=42067 RepID=A0ACB7CBT4_9ASCO|nr:hypothetical protein PORY_001246 [Pneumocystis oryctolagi]